VKGTSVGAGVDKGDPAADEEVERLCGESKNEVKGNGINGDDKGAGGREKVGKGVGILIGEICSENISVMADSGTISVVTSKNSEG